MTQEKVLRQIIKIDRDKCDGCGLCATACHEGAIQIIDGKAELVSESYCDGLGDCIGECPVGAITFEEREVDAYDHEAVQAHLSARASGGCPGSAPQGLKIPAYPEGPKPSGCPGSAAQGLKSPDATAPAGPLPCGCPGSMAKAIKSPNVEVMSRRLTEILQNCDEPSVEESATPRQAELANWPVQLRLVPENAPYLVGAHLVISADCVPFAYADFHRDFLKGDGKVCLVGCPKLDDVEFYRQKIQRIIETARPSSITVLSMEVPCCNGMPRLVTAAIEAADVSIDYTWCRIALRGGILEKEKTKYRFA